MFWSMKWYKEIHKVPSEKSSSKWGGTSWTQRLVFEICLYVFLVVQESYWTGTFVQHCSSTHWNITVTRASVLDQAVLRSLLIVYYSLLFSNWSPGETEVLRGRWRQFHFHLFTGGEHFGSHIFLLSPSQAFCIEPLCILTTQQLFSFLWH